jgi:heptosyltransferase-1
LKELILKKRPKKILIIKPSSLGDVVHSLPFLKSLNETFSDAEIHWVIAKGLEGLLENHPMIKRVWIINKDDWKNLKTLERTIKEFRDLFSGLKKESYDIAIDLQGLFRSGIIAYMTGSSIRIGFNSSREGSSLFYTHKVESERSIHAVDRYLKIASALGCVIGEISFPLPLVKEKDYIKDIKEKIGDYVVLIPSARWKTKIWRAERFGELAQMLNMRSVIIGSNSDREIAKKIEGLSSGKAISLAGRTDLKDIISLIRGGRFVVSNDTGPMHIAAALNKPVVAIFGPTSPERTGPYGKNHLIIRSLLPCSPCFKKRCSDIKCMDSIKVEDVFDRIKKLL